MFNSKMYVVLALALPFIGAAPAQAGWNAWQSLPITQTASQQPTVAQPTVAPEPGYEAYGSARKRARHRAIIGTPAGSHHPGMTGHTFHHPGH